MVTIATRAYAQGLSIVAAGLLSLASALPAHGQPAQHYKQTNLVSDQAGMAAVTDPNLVNPWGMSRSSGSPWWISDNGPGLATLYSGAGAIESLVVTVPAAVSGQSGTPSGQVYNGTTGFQVAAGKPALFMFVSEDGTLSAWNPTVNSGTPVVEVNTNSASVFKGVAIASINDASGPAYFLYVADFRKGHINVYDTNFHPIRMFGDAFQDRFLPRGFAPFNVQNIGGNLYVAFAKQDAEKHDEVDGAGLGFVDVFSPSGQLLQRLQWGPWFSGPWGLAQAPSDFGALSHDILVGQFGSGQILAFDPITGRFKGPLYDATNKPIAIDGLWAIAFGSGGTSGPATTLYFTAGSDGESHGLFGTITAVENVLGGDL